jgi:NADPH-dependent glutamate synthase beta subunit-like oxidoreductase
MMRPFKHVNAGSLDEVVSVLNEYGERARVVAGGTDLLGALKDNIHSASPDLLVNLKSLSGLAYIKESKEGLRIGALTKLHDIEKNKVVRERYGVLAQAAKTVASPQIRNMATIGGNICQEVRCWYYRNPENMFHCMRKGGTSCNAMMGENRYHSIFGAARVDYTACSSNCPGHTDIPSYMSKAKEGDVPEAVKTILEVNPIPSITGRVCPHFCEQTCNRCAFDDSVSIRSVERYLGDYVLDNASEYFRPPEVEIRRKIAIIGSGPAGLSAAYYLRRSGYRVTVFERMKEAGGMLTYGIPPYRLPKDVVRRQIKAFENCGIEFKYEVHVGQDISLSELQKNFDAVFLACGAWKTKGIGIPGENLMISGLDLLCKINMGNRDLPGKKVAVIGGGNVAMDVARTLLRLGCQPSVVYRRSQTEMPAIPEEVEKAKEEGVRFEFLTLPVEAVRSDDKVLLKCIRMKLGVADESGRARPEQVAGSEFSNHFDAVIKAIGEDADSSFVPKQFINERTELRSEPSGQHLGENLFAGGDFLTGPSTVVEAVAAGKEVAHLIEEYLREGQSEAVQKTEERKGLLEKLNSSSFTRVARSYTPELPVSERVKSIEIEDSMGLSRREIEMEASRCLNCACVAVSPSDIAPALIALGAQIKTTKRTVDAGVFFKAELLKSTVLATNEVVTEIVIPASKPGSKQSYNKFRIRKSIDFPIVSVASVLSVQDKKVVEARIALGAVAPIPLRIADAEDFLKGKTISEDVAEETARLALKEAKPLARNGYKIQVAKALIKRAILAAV